jgi:succinate dehydrogenase / fumarate reductase, cytochrome b subunit
MPARPRPLSPHLQVYRWQIGNTLSILHRLTGVALALGLVALGVWLMALAGGEESFGTAMRFFASPLGLLFMIGWTFAFFYHLASGVRHLFWDAGRGFERAQRVAGAWLVVVSACVLTLAVGWLMLRGARP